MERRIGLDVHAASCTAAVVGARGKRLGAQALPTNGDARVSFLESRAGTLRVSGKEGTQSEWLYQLLSSRATEVVLTGIGAPETKGPRGQRNDELDAYDLADCHRRNALPRTVFKDNGQPTTLRQRVKVHASMVHDAVRAQSRLKVLFRSRGIAVTGKNVFKGAATTLVMQHRSSLPYAGYDRMLAAGTKPNVAKVTLARKIASITLTMWKTKEAYDREKMTSKVP